VDDIVEGDYVLVLQLLHQGDFTDGGAGCPLFGIEVDFFEGYKFTRLPVASFENLLLSAGWSNIGCDREVSR
jgi:hypothetical protein